MNRVLFENGMIITVNPRDDVIALGWLLVEDDVIAGMGGGRYEGGLKIDQRINASGKCILPGIVDVHTHVCGSLFKALTEDGPNAFYDLALPMEDVLTPESTYRLSLLGLLECLKGGVTCINDIYHFMSSTARATADMKMRGVLAQKIIERNLGRIRYDDYTLLPKEGEWRLEAGVRLIEEYHNSENGKILCKLGPHATDTISMELARKIRDLGDRYGVGFHIHVAQKQKEVDFLRREYNCTPVEYLCETGLMRENTTAAHCVLVSDRDIELLGAGGITVAHCAEMSGKRGSLPPMKKFADQKVKFCLGTDWVTMDSWTSMRFAICADRMMGCDLDDINARVALRKSTIEPAIHLGLGDKIGSLETGKQADIIMIDMKNANLVPVFQDLIATIVYNANRHDVEFVMIAGEILVRERELLIADEAEILRDGQRTAMELYNQFMGTGH